MGVVQRGVHAWKGLLQVAVLVLFNGMILSQSGLLSYSQFTWKAFAGSYPLLDLGEACASPGECTSGFCADGICCNEPCTEAGAVCLAGICTPASPVPALSGTGQALAVLVLLGGALLGWRLRPAD